MHIIMLTYRWVKSLPMIVPSVDGLLPDMEVQDSTFKRSSSNLDPTKLGPSGSSDTSRRASKQKWVKWSLTITLLRDLCFRKVIFLNNSQTSGNGTNGLSAISQMKRHKMLCKLLTSILLHILLMVVHTISKRLKSPNNLQTLVNGTNGSLDISLKKKHKMQW